MRNIYFALSVACTPYKSPKNDMNEPPASTVRHGEPDSETNPQGKPLGLSRERLQRMGAFVRSTAPFAAGVLAALSALLLYNGLFPGPHPLTAGEANDSNAHAL